MKGDACVQFTPDKETILGRVLRIAWSPRSDDFTFSKSFRVELIPFPSREHRPTKRVVMSCVMSLFDPLGMLAPFIIFGKMLVQDVWRCGSDWGQPIDNASNEKWQRWIERLPEIEEAEIPRYYFRKSSSIDLRSLQLHVLVNASKDAYGAVAYFRVLTDEGPICSLVMARSKMAPLKLLSIPSLELQAAVIGSRQLHSVIEAHSLEVTQRSIWSDSKTVISWMQSKQRKYKPFVAFRIGKILSLTKYSDWRWISTTSPWFHGPRFLYQPEEQWEQQDTVESNTPEELRSCHLVHNVSIARSVIDVGRFSIWKVLVRTVACLYRFCSNCKRKREGLPIEAVPATTRMKVLVKKGIPAVTVLLQRNEHQQAEAYLWRTAQSEVYEEEIKLLTKNRELAFAEWRALDRSSSLYNVSPFLDVQDVLRMDGRITASL